MDPFVVARWPEHRFAFYEEWLIDLIDQENLAADAQQQAEIDALKPEGSVGIEGLAGLGVNVREVI